MFKIKFLPYNIEAEVFPEETILEIAMRYGIHINASCGGVGSCNKCKIIIEEGKVKGELIEGKYYKACATIPLSDLVVRIPVESEVDRRALLRKPKKRAQALVLEKKEPVESPYQKLYFQLNPPTIEENLADWIRLKRALNKQNISNPEINLNFLQKLPYTLREQDFQITLNVYHDPRKDRFYLLDIESGDKRNINLGVAIDIGTTTLQLELVDLNTGEVLAFTSDYNPQISYGEDVISRIEFARKKDGLKLLAEKVREKLKELIKELLRIAKRDLDEINLISVAGNSVMSHLFLELEPRYLREYPYVPATTEFPIISAKDLGLSSKESTLVQLAPCRASYVGGDITAGVIASLIAEEDPLTLFIDLGTNGEIVIGNKDFLICAACSAGPAFEGGGIKHGMRATSGAIEAVSIDPISFEPMIITIGKKKPRGICGSGIISLLANLFRVGLVDKAGKYRKDIKHSRLREGENGWEYVLVWKEESATGEDIVFTENDIENLIRAKGAMFAGYQILLESIGLSVNDLERVYLAGTFGTYIDLEEAITIGLLPDLSREKFYFLGNTSLKGAKFALLYKDTLLKMEKVVNMMTHIELSNYPNYMDYYMAALFLPHTDENLFPSVKI
ncbi:ASKHA domain-containing protein [Thermodesulfobacterium hydrogeniphilum]|uniref:ASKHA domain-containing protein n=1 Tax=Thermodesulfobacterium hydrogeniphilum TaxID=161156 RepID=UPI00056EA349|nr:ASKHA domain-containing protein [Thermodesulfobacterium hydrogeniphilum]